MGKSGRLGVNKEIKMFFGESEYRIDEKGKVPTPPRFRRELKEGVVLTPGIEQCITAYPLAEWKKLAVCNFLGSMHLNGSRLENRQLDNKGRRNQSGRF